jgi:CxxC-x17-CxxC domain-containing protein
MFPAVCGTCGENCEVPFKPTGMHPVFCRTCFKNQGGDNARSMGAPRFAPKSFGDRNIGSKFGGNAGSSVPMTPVSSISKAQFEALSNKVDRILDILIAAQMDEEIPAPKETKRETLKADLSEVKIDKKVANKAAPVKKAKGKKK